jgi:hypothetical protein
MQLPLHPDEILPVVQPSNRFVAWNASVADWVTNHVLASLLMFDLALIVPLVALPGPMWLKWWVTILSSNWIQLWALPALQRSQNKIQALQIAKAHVDHRNITYLMALLEHIEERLPRAE